MQDTKDKKLTTEQIRGDNYLAGLENEVQDARDQKLTAEQIRPIVAALRSGDVTAVYRLQVGLRHLLYEDRHGRPLEQTEIRSKLPTLGIRYIGLCTAIDQLAENDVIDVLFHVGEEIRRSTRDFCRAESQDIIPPSSTNAARRKLGKPIYPTLHRVDVPPSAGTEDGYCVDSLYEDASLRHPDQRLERQYMPYEYAIANELSEALATSDFERDCIGMRLDGFPIRTIAAVLSTSKARVEKTLAIFQARKERRAA